MNRLTTMLIATILLLGLAHCGGEKKVAPESGVEAADPHAGMDHGKDAMPGMDHSAHDHAAMERAAKESATIDHAAMGHAAASVDHAAMGHTTARVDHAAMGHTAPAPSGHSAHSASRAATNVDHSAHAAPAGQAHAPASPPSAHQGHGKTEARPASEAHADASTPNDSHAAHTGTARAPSAGAGEQAQHAQSSPAIDHAAHAQHPVETSAHAHHPAAAAISSPGMAPSSDIALRNGDPSSTLSPDRFDAAASISVSEAAKARAGGGHEGHSMLGITPGEDEENPPTPMPATRDLTTASPAGHSAHEPTTPPSSSLYVCPMHPEVTSDQPGTCPKCGMALVEKE